MNWKKAALLLVLYGCERQEGSAGPPPLASTAASPSLIPAPPPSAPSSTAAATPAPRPTPASGAWSFDADAPGAPPKGFAFGRTGGGREGKWLVRPEPGATGANALVQTDADNTDFRFPIALAEPLALRDVDLSVRCKAISGGTDQACGLVFRARDFNNYYVTRANALENNVRLYSVKDGKRQQIESWSGKVSAGAWHDYRVVAKGDHLEVHWNGAKVIDAHDKTFADAGRVGLWTKADSVTAFDDFKATGL